MSTTSTTDVTQFTGTWKLDPHRTSVTLRTKSMWILPVNGTAQALRGEAVIGPDGGVQGSLVIDAASFNTSNHKRDEHLRTGDFFDAAAYPAIVFEASTARPGERGCFEVTGQLTVRGRTHPLTLPVQISASDGAATVSAKVEIDRSNWGITWGAKMGVGLKSQVTISAHFDRD